MLRRLKPAIDEMVRNLVDEKLRAIEEAKEEWIGPKVLLQRIEDTLGYKESWVRHRMDLLERKKADNRGYLYEWNQAKRVLTEAAMAPHSYPKGGCRIMAV